MQSYVDKLKADTAAAKQRRENDAKAKAKLLMNDTRVMCEEKLTDQIRILFERSPDFLKTKQILISDLVPLLRGRFKSNPSAGDVGQALHSLRYIRKRDWKSNRRYWEPPDEYSPF